MWLALGNLPKAADLRVAITQVKVQQAGIDACCQADLSRINPLGVNPRA